MRCGYPVWCWRTREIANIPLIINPACDNLKEILIVSWNVALVANHRLAGDIATTTRKSNDGGKPKENEKIYVFDDKYLKTFMANVYK